MPQPKRLRAAPASVTVDTDRIRMREWIDIEDFAGTGFRDLPIAQWPMRATTALVWVILRRDDPSLTLDEVLDWDFDRLGEAVDSFPMAVEPEGNAPAATES